MTIEIRPSDSLHIPSFAARVVITGERFRGVWNASSNSPALVSGVGTQGDYYKVTVAGTTSVDGIASWAIGDRIIFNGTSWQKEPGADVLTQQQADLIVDVVAPGNITLSGEQTLDGFATSASIVTVPFQTAGAQNGIYRSASGAWSRLPGFTTYDAHCGLLVQVKRGTLYGKRIFLGTSDPGGTLGSTALAFTDQSVQQASTIQAGVVELLTDAEVRAGTDADRAVQAAGLATIIREFTGVLSNNSVVSFGLGGTLPIGFGLVVIHTVGKSALFTHKVTSGFSVTPIVEGSEGSLLDWTTGVLAGTTGTATHATVSIHTNSVLYLENRLGNSVVYSVILFGA